jgi:DNA-binding XRE family transcriptional regulator
LTRQSDSINVVLERRNKINFGGGIMQELFDQLRMKRLELRLSQREVDEKAGLSTHTMFKLENGRVRNMAIISKVANFLGGVIRIDFGGRS